MATWKPLVFKIKTIYFLLSRILIILLSYHMDLIRSTHVFFLFHAEGGRIYDINLRYTYQYFSHSEIVFFFILSICVQFFPTFSQLILNSFVHHIGWLNAAVARSNNMSIFPCPLNPSLPFKGPDHQSNLKTKPPYPSLLSPSSKHHFLQEALPDKSFYPSTACSPSSLTAFCHTVFIKNSIMVYNVWHQ